MIIQTRLNIKLNLNWIKPTRELNLRLKILEIGKVLFNIHQWCTINMICLLSALPNKGTEEPKFSKFPFVLGHQFGIVHSRR